jgi:1,4-alpha-glucan branching enzyme
MSRDPVHRKFHHSELTFSMLYAYSENYILPLSHDEVVHGKRSILEKMPGDDWQKFANLRAYYSFMWAHPGKKLLFMGDEFAQRNEWNHDRSIDWHLLQYEPHRGIQRLVSDLNALYRRSPALYEMDQDPAGFEWLEADDCTNSAFIFLRKGTNPDDSLLVAINMTPTTRDNYRVGVPGPGFYQEVFNSNSDIYGGSGIGNMGGVQATDQPHHGNEWSIGIVLPPLATVILACPSGHSGI